MYTIIFAIISQNMNFSVKDDKRIDSGIKGHGHSCGQILLLCFYCLQALLKHLNAQPNKQDTSLQ